MEYKGIPQLACGVEGGVTPLSEIRNPKSQIQNQMSAVRGFGKAFTVRYDLNKSLSSTLHNDILYVGRVHLTLFV